jgi:hypothetical protein
MSDSIAPDNFPPDNPMLEPTKPTATSAAIPNPDPPDNMNTSLDIPDSLKNLLSNASNTDDTSNGAYYTRYTHEFCASLTSSDYYTYQTQAFKGVLKEYRFDADNPMDVLTKAKSNMEEAAFALTAKGIINRKNKLETFLTEFGLREPFDTIYTQWHTTPKGLIPIFSSSKKLFEDFHSISLSDVVNTVNFVKQYTNLAHPTLGKVNKEHSRDYVMSGIAIYNSCEPALQSWLDTQIGISTDPTLRRYGNSGPVRFYLIWSRYANVDGAVATSIQNALTKLRVRDLPGENVSLYFDTLTIIEEYLSSMGRVIPNFVSHVTNILIDVSVDDYSLFLKTQQFVSNPALLDIHTLRKLACDQYQLLLNSGKWHPTAKTGAAFHAAQGFTNGTAHPSANVNQSPAPTRPRLSREEWEKTIDRNPPSQGSPHCCKSLKGDFNEYWCNTCHRWGNHPTNKTGHPTAKLGHAEFLDKCKQRNAKREKPDSPSTPSANVNNTDTPVGASSSGALQLLCTTPLSQFHSFGVPAANF